MTMRNKIFFWFAGIVTVFLAAVIFLAPVYLNSASAKSGIEAAVSKRLGGTISYGQLDLFLFPRPHITISKLKLRYPRTFRGTLQSLDIYPQIMPMLFGKLRFAKIRITGPDFRVILPATVSESTAEAPSVEEAKQDIRTVLRYLESIGAGLVTEMDNGKFLFRRSHRDFLSLKNVTVHFNAPPGEIKFLVKASAEPWGDFSLNGAYSFSEEKSEIRDLALSMGRSTLTGFSADLYWDSIPWLNVLSGSAVVALDESYSWLSSSESMTPLLKQVRLQRGVLTISSLQGGGALYRPETWSGQISGEVRDVLAESHWLPAPMSINTRFRIDDKALELTGLAAGIGSSSLDNVSARFVANKAAAFAVSEGRASIDLSELFRWRNKYEQTVNLFKDIDDLTGEFTLSSLRMGGPLLQPAKWRLNITGAVKGMAIGSPLLPASLAVSGRFNLEENKVAISDTTVHLGTSSLSRVSASIIGRDDPLLEISSANALIHAGELFQWRSKYPALDTTLKGVDDLKGDLTISSLTFKGPLLHPETGTITAAGGLDHVVIGASILPGPIGLVRGDFSFVPGSLSFDLHEATILDSSLTGTAVISGTTNTLHFIDLTLNGNSSRKTLDWIFKTLELPPELMIKTPIEVRNARLGWEKTKGFTFMGAISVADGPAFTIDLSQHDTDLNVRRLVVKDRETNAAITVNWQRQKADISYSGVTAQSTLGRIFEQGNFGNGTLQGDIHAVIHTDQPLRSRIKGILGGSDIFVPWGMPVPTTIDRFTLHADEDVLTLDTADVTWDKNHYSMEGAVTTSDEGIAFSMALKADGIDIQTIRQALEQPDKKSTDQKVRSFPVPPIRGDLRADSSYVKFGSFTFAPAHAVITVDPDRVNMEFADTRTCDISIPGSLLISRESISFTFTPTAKKEALGFTISCLTSMDVHISGEYDLSSSFKSHGTGKELISSLEGRVDFKARNGKIYHYPLLQKIVSVLSVLEVFRGKTPEIGGSGYPYHAMALQGDIHRGKFTIEKAYIGGQSLDIIAQGEVDFAEGKMDLVVLVAPFSSINWLIRHTPIVGTIMGGTLITIPVRVSGDMTEPDVVFLSPTAVGKRILSIMKNIIKLPVDIISPLMPKETEEKK
jgi:hypothetical protein